MSKTARPPMSPPAHPAQAFSHAEILRVFLGAMVCIFLAALDQTVVIPALPAIASDLGAYRGLSWIIAAYLITTTISTPIYGKLSDIYGRRKMLSACIAIFIATSMVCGAAQSLHQLVWFRALQGLGGGGLMALTQSAIADVVAPRERGRYQGYISAVWAITSVCGPVVGGVMVQSLSWRWIFWINLPVGLLALWACHHALRRLSPPQLSGRPTLDIIGMVLLSGAITVWLLALGWGGGVYAWGSPEILFLAGLGSFLLLLLLAQERRANDPLLPPRVFRSASYVANLAVSTLTSLLIFLCLLTVPLYFQLARGASATQSGIYLVPFMLSSAAGNIIGSFGGRYFGAFRGILRIATALCLAGFVVLVALPLDAPVTAIIAGLIITGLGVGACLIGSITGAQNALIAPDIGAGTGALLVLRSVGGASGSTLAGAIITARLTLIRDVAGKPAPAAHQGAAAQGAAAQGAAALSHAARTSSTAALGHAFAMVYTAAAILALASFAVALLMPDSRLRETIHPAPAPQ